MALDGRPLCEFIVPTWNVLTDLAPDGASISLWRLGRKTDKEAH